MTKEEARAITDFLLRNCSMGLVFDYDDETHLEIISEALENTPSILITYLLDAAETWKQHMENKGKNFEEEIVSCMEIEDIDEMRERMKEYDGYFSSKEHLSQLTPEKIELLGKSKKAQTEYDIKFVRTQFGILGGAAGSPCANLIGMSEICIERNGKRYYVSSNFIDEVSETLSLCVNEESVWALNFTKQLIPAEKELTKEDLEQLKKFKTMVSYDSDDAAWINSEYAPLFVAVIDNLAKAFIEYEAEEIDARSLCKRYFYSKLWKCNFLSPSEWEGILTIADY